MRQLFLIMVAALSLGLFGCEDEEIMQPGEAPQQQRPAGSASADAEGEPPPPPPMDFAESDFVETEEARDPFRDYAYLFVRKSRTGQIVQRKVKASPFALDELKLVGIITKGRHSVMLTDPTGFGWVLYTGDYVGRAELVSAGGTDGTEVAINWRVDRIRNKDVVFIREDNAHPDIAPTTRVMPLYPAGEDT